MRLSFIFIIIIIQMLINIPLAAQPDPGLNRLSLTIFGNSNFPLNHFAEKIGDNPRITRRFGFDYGEKVGLAVIGFGAGAELNQQVFNEHLTWIISTRLLMNPVDNSEIDTFFRNEFKDSVDIAFENGQWINIPVFTGFSYYLNLYDNLCLYWTLQGGLNITKQPYRKIFVNNELVEETTFKFTPDFGFEIGFGFELLGRYNLGIRYVNLSNPRYEGTRTLNESFFKSIPKREMNVDGDERPISMIMVLLGYRL